MTGQNIGAVDEWRAHWPTVLVSAIGMSYTTIYVYALGALIQPIEQEFGWSRTAISSGISATTTVLAMLGPITGWVIDRVGSRRIAIPGTIIYWLAFACLSLTTASLWSWWILWAIVGLTAIGIKPALWTSGVAGLFARGRGFALAVTLCGTGIGSFITPILTTWLVDHYGWRAAFIGLSLFYGGLGFPLLLFFFHDARSKRISGYSAPLPPRDGMAIREALLSRQFIMLFIAALLFSLLAISTVANMIPILSSLGVSRAEAAGIAASAGLSSIVGRLTTGWLLDRFEPRYITTIAMALPVVTATLLLALPISVPVALAAALLMGLALGAEVDAVAFLTGRYFGLKNYALLFSTIMSGMAIPTGFGPLMASRIFDVTGSYHLQLVTIIPLSIASALLILTLGRPRIAADGSAPTGAQA